MCFKLKLLCMCIFMWVWDQLVRSIGSWEVQYMQWIPQWLGPLTDKPQKAGITHDWINVSKLISHDTCPVAQMIFLPGLCHGAVTGSGFSPSWLDQKSCNDDWLIGVCACKANIKGWAGLRSWELPHTYFIWKKNCIFIGLKQIYF